MNYKTSLELKKRTITNEEKPLNGFFSKWKLFKMEFFFCKMKCSSLGSRKNSTYN